MSKSEPQTELIPQEPAAPPAPAERMDTGSSVLRLLNVAVEKGIKPEALEKLVALHERVQDRQAAHEFAAAMAGFQATCPLVPKESTATVTTGGGGQFAYQYADLPTIARTIGPHLHSYGLSYSWDSEVSEKGMLTCTCIVRHQNGHSVRATFTCPTDSASRAMSPQQKVASALKFAQRKSLEQALGLTTTEADSDGAEPPEMMSAEQVKRIEGLLLQTRADFVKFAEWIGSSDPKEWPASKFAQAEASLVKRLPKEGPAA